MLDRMFTMRMTQDPNVLDILCCIPVEESFDGPERMEFAETNPGFTLIVNPDFSFRKLAIHGQEDYHAVVIKNRSPEIAFVITHPNMVQALNHYTAPIIQP